MDLENAISKHSEWKLKFRNAIAKKETLDAATIAKDNACELGKWLHGEAKSKYAGLASYANCLVKHAAFHVEAGKVANMINAKKFQDAEAMLGTGTAFTATSGAVGVAIIGLKKETR